MSAENWTLRKELKPSRTACRAILRILHRKMPGTSVDSVDSIISATRHWGLRVRASLLAVRKKDGKRKTISFNRDWRSDEVPSHVDPLVIPETGSVAFSPITDSGFDFSPLSELVRNLSGGEKLETALVNFFNWAAERLVSGKSLLGFSGEVCIERFKIADCYVYEQNGEEHEIWGNEETNEAWDRTPSLDAVDAPENRVGQKLAAFLVPFGSVCTLFWWLAMRKNIVNVTPAVPEIQFGLCCAALSVLVGLFVRGWLAKLVGLGCVAVASFILVPWLGETWDMTSEVALLSPVVSGELADAPMAAVYEAGVVGMSLLALLVAPSVALLPMGGIGRLALACLFAIGVSPWPRALSEMTGDFAPHLRGMLVAMAVIAVVLVGRCGWALARSPARHTGNDGLIVRIESMRRPSSWLTWLCVIVGVLLVTVQGILVFGGVK